MSFTDRTCVQCGAGYSFYQERNAVKDCPKCGAWGGYYPLPSTKEYDNMMGLNNNSSFDDSKTLKHQ